MFPFAFSLGYQFTESQSKVFHYEEEWKTDQSLWFQNE